MGDSKADFSAEGCAETNLLSQGRRTAVLACGWNNDMGFVERLECVYSLQLG